MLWTTVPLWSSSFLFFATSVSCCSMIRFLRSCTLSALAFEFAASICLFSSVFLYSFFPRFKVGTQSMLWRSQTGAAFPDTKWRPQTRLLSRIFFVLVSPRLMAEIHSLLLSLVSSSCSSPWLVTIFGMEANVTRCFPMLTRSQSHATFSLFTFEGHKDGG